MAEIINPFEIECDSTVVERSAALSKMMELTTITMAESTCRLHIPTRKLEGTSVAIEMGFETGHAFESESSVCISVVKLHCKGKIKASKDDQSIVGKDIFTINATYAVESKMSSDFIHDGEQNELFSAFSTTNAPLMVWPFWREFIQSASGRMGVVPIVAPFLRIKVDKTRTEDTPKEP